MIKKGTDKEVDKNVLRWINRLRSGKYNQTQNQLSNHMGGFCCLGVAIAKNNKEVYCGLSNCLGLLINSKGQKMFGLSVVDLRILSEMNDDLSKGFKEISNIIEEAWSSGEDISH